MPHRGITIPSLVRVCRYLHRGLVGQGSEDTAAVVILDFYSPSSIVFIILIRIP